MAEMLDIEKRLDAMEQMIPESGYNVVVVDDFEAPGEELSLAASFEDKAEAESLAEELQKRGVKAYVYGADLRGKGPTQKWAEKKLEEESEGEE